MAITRLITQDIGVSPQKTATIRLELSADATYTSSFTAIAQPLYARSLQTTGVVYAGVTYNGKYNNTGTYSLASGDELFVYSLTTAGSVMRFSGNTTFKVVTKAQAVALPVTQTGTLVVVAFTAAQAMAPGDAAQSSFGQTAYFTRLWRYELFSAGSTIATGRIRITDPIASPSWPTGLVVSKLTAQIT